VPAEPIIRPARVEDAEAAGDLAARAWESVYEGRRGLLGEGIFSAAYPDWQAEKRRQVLEHIREHPEEALVTELDGRVVGFITWHPWPRGSVGEIGNNAVAPEAQGRGIGAAQCRRVLGLLAERGFSVAVVATGLDEAHAPARRMYQKAGFGPSFPSVHYFQSLRERGRGAGGDR